jgi:hypothetical protein
MVELRPLENTQLHCDSTETGSGSSKLRRRISPMVWLRHELHFESTRRVKVAAAAAGDNF